MPNVSRQPQRLPLKILAALALLAFCRNAALATTAYHLRLQPAGGAGLPATLTFDLTHSDQPGSNLNRAVFTNVSYDGRADSALVEGGPAYGDLLSGANPAMQTTLEGQFFHNSLAVPFEQLGSLIVLQLDLTEANAAPTVAPDELSMYVIEPSTGLPYRTADDLGTNVLFAVDITGQAGGDLIVFAPMTFIAPDSLILDGSLVGVPPRAGLESRLRFVSVAPNPSPSGIRIVYEVPSPGGRLCVRVFDVAGRKVAEPFNGARRAGVWTADWDARVAGGHAAPGVYIVQLAMGGQSLVRRTVLTR